MYLVTFTIVTFFAFLLLSFYVKSILLTTLFLNTYCHYSIRNMDTRIVLKYFLKLLLIMHPQCATAMMASVQKQTLMCI